MWDFIQGVIVIFLVILILALRDSKNKWIAYLGWGIFLLAKILR